MKGYEASSNLRALWLRITKPKEGGPRARSVLIGLAESKGWGAIAEPLLELMLAEGTFVMHGDKRAATYGPPKRRPR